MITNADLRSRVKNLTKRDKDVLDAVIAYFEAHGYAPSIEEIGQACGMASKSTVHNHVTKLLLLGYLETDAEYGSPRAIRVPGYHFVKKERD